MVRRFVGRLYDREESYIKLVNRRKLSIPRLALYYAGTSCEYTSLATHGLTEHQIQPRQAQRCAWTLLRYAHVLSSSCRGLRC